MMNYLYYPIFEGNTSYKRAHKCTASRIKLNSYKDEVITTSQCSPRFRTKSALQFNVDSNASENSIKRKSNVSFIKTTKLNFNKVKTASLGNNYSKNKYKAVTDRNKQGESGCSLYKKKHLHKSSSCNNVHYYTRNSKAASKRNYKDNNLSSVVVLSNAHNWKYQHNRKDSLYSTKGNTTCDDSKIPK